MGTPDSTAAYYARRAMEYERIYSKPERQGELARLKDGLTQCFAGRDILEIACGTGYWTQVVASGARSILATDVNEEVLSIARQKDYGQCRVRFQQADAYILEGVSRRFNACLVAFWWSHVPRSRRVEFLSALRARLEPEAVLVLVDNQYVHGSNSPMADRVDDEGNTYSLRRLADGSTWEVLKNFPTEAELRTDLSEISDSIEHESLTYYWWTKCRCHD